MSKVIGVTVGTPMNPEKLGGDGAVHDWAKQPEKPKYTAEEVGALSSEICSDRNAINIEPNITRYHLSASAASMINCANMALIPDGYKAEIIIDNPYGEPTLPFFSNVLKDTSDDGKALTGLNGFVARDGAVLTIYKVRDADKFNWYLSKHGLPISGVAQIGQTIVVKSVDDAMRPTEWETANLPTGGGSEWRYEQTITLTEGVNEIVIDKDTEGNPLKLEKAHIELYCAPNGSDKAVWLNGFLEDKNILGVKEAIRHDYWTRTFMYFDLEKNIYVVSSGYDYQNSFNTSYNRGVSIVSVSPFRIKEYISSIKFNGGLFATGTVVSIKGVIK